MVVDCTNTKRSCISENWAQFHIQKSFMYTKVKQHIVFTGVSNSVRLEPYQSSWLIARRLKISWGNFFFLKKRMVKSKGKWEGKNDKWILKSQVQSWNFFRRGENLLTKKKPLIFTSANLYRISFPIQYFLLLLSVVFLLVWYRLFILQERSVSFSLELCYGQVKKKSWDSSC